VPERCYLLAGGGTGGHLFPGIAVAEALLEREPNARILFVGSDREIEVKILAATNYEHLSIPAMSLSGAVRRPVRFLQRSMAAIRTVGRFIEERTPDVVIGCGGFASAAPVLAARRRGIPFVLLEQNVIPGRSTRWLSRLGGRVCLSFESTRERLPRSVETILTGNPVRRAIGDLACTSDAEPPSTAGHNQLLVLGGSQGARAINDMLIAFVEEHPEALHAWRIVHQTGAADDKRVRRHYESQGINAEVGAFFDDMPQRYRHSTLAVARAGATTLAELACAGLPAILVPYPHAADNHQWHNAAFFADAGAAVIVEQETTGRCNETFQMALRALLAVDDLRTFMRKDMAQLARPDAAGSVVNVVHELIDEMT